MFYQLVYENFNRRKSTIKIILLTIAVLIDFFNIYNLLQLCFGDLYSLIDFTVLIAISVVIRLIALRLCYKYKITYKDGIVQIIKILPLSKKILVNVEANELTVENHILNLKSLNKSKNTVIIIDNNEMLAYYDIKCKSKDNKSNTRIIIPLDKYMYYLIAEKKEKNNDLSR